MRLDRFVSQSAPMSRSQARTLIRDGGVVVEGRAVRDAAHPVEAHQLVVVDGRPLVLPGPLYLMMYKPCGVLSATRDAHQETVVSLLPDAFAARVHPAGRLDKDTSGLLLLTDDGAWSHRLTSPAHHCAKTYLAELARPIDEGAAERLRLGLMLRGETRPTRPAGVELLAPTRARVVISEGRYHQVRRMFAAIGSHVVRLHRERIGGLCLDPDLAPGDWRALTDRERSDVFA